MHFEQKFVLFVHPSQTKTAESLFVDNDKDSFTQLIFMLTGQVNSGQIEDSRVWLYGKGWGKLSWRCMRQHNFPLPLLNTIVKKQYIWSKSKVHYSLFHCYHGVCSIWNSVRAWPGYLDISHNVSPPSHPTPIKCMIPCQGAGGSGGYPFPNSDKA